MRINPVVVSQMPCYSALSRRNMVGNCRAFDFIILEDEDLKIAGQGGYANTGLTMVSVTTKGAELLAQTWCTENDKTAKIGLTWQRLDFMHIKPCGKRACK
jgi:hypothetical protein